MLYLRKIVGAVVALLVIAAAVPAQERGLGTPAAPGTRHALVIGNDGYLHLPRLERAGADARAVGARLEGLGFEVLRVTDADRRAMARSLDSFARRLRPGDVALVFYAGHGVGIGGENHLLPVDMPKIAPGQESLLRYESFALSDLLAQLRGTGARATVAIIDACRDNPLATSGTRSIGQTRGLGRLAQAQTGSFVIYSAGAGQTALDRLGPSDRDANSVFTRVLLRELERPGQDLVDIARRVRGDVGQLAASLPHSQIPAYYDELPGGLVLVPGQEAVAAPTPAPAPVVPRDTMREDFAIAERMGTAEAWEAFIAQYGSRGGFLVTTARSALARLRQVATAPAPAPQVSPAPSPSAATLVVDAAGGGDFRSIAEAVKAARPNTVIGIREGRYTGGVDVDKPLELVGIGRRDLIVWEARGEPVVRWTAKGGRIANLTIRMTAGDHHALSVTSGAEALVETSDLTNTGSLDTRGRAIVAVSGGADVTLRGNLIHASARNGISYSDGARGTVEDNEIFGNARAGILIETGGDPLVARNRIRDGKSGGVFVLDGGKGRIEDNEIFGNAYSGISIATGGDPLVARNRIRDGKQAGVFVHDNGKGRIEDNEIFGSALAGIEIRTGGDPLVARNRIRDGKVGGVRVYENGKGRIEDNEIFGNADAGIEIRSGSDPLVAGNRITKNRGAAIYVWEKGRGRIIGNDLRGNGGKGAFDIAGNAGPVIRRDNRE